MSGARGLWLVRHARPEIAAGLCYGRLDVRAEPQATRQAAAALGAALRPHGDECAFWHSPLRRCGQLACALQALEPAFISRPEARLLELDFGQWEGRAWDEIGEAAVSAWARDLGHHAPAGGESLARMLERVHAALRDARALPQRQVVWLCHAGVARCVQWLMAHGTRLPQAHEWTLPAPGYGQWLRLPL